MHQTYDAPPFIFERAAQCVGVGRKQTMEDTFHTNNVRERFGSSSSVSRVMAVVYAIIVFGPEREMAAPAILYVSLILSVQCHSDRMPVAECPLIVRK